MRIEMITKKMIMLAMMTKKKKKMMMMMRLTVPTLLSRRSRSLEPGS